MSENLVELERRIQRLEDIEAIKVLKARYADACDRNYDADTLASLFAEDAIWDGGLFGVHEGREAMRAFFEGVSSDIPIAMHYQMNPIIEVGGEEATGNWYPFQTCTFADGDGKQAIFGAGRYDEQFRRIDGDWKFSRLTLSSIFWTPFDKGWVEQPFVQNG